MSLIDNQSYRKKMTYYNETETDKKVTIGINISCNHDINKNIISQIEQYVQNLFFANYIDEAKFKTLEKERKIKEKKEDKELLAYKKRMGIEG